MATKDLKFPSWPGRISSEIGSRFWGRARIALRLSPFDATDEQGRSNERYRRAAWTTVSSMVAMGTSILTTLISVRLTVRYLGTERYGLWMTITSFLVMLNFADLGMGNGLLNAISEAHGIDDQQSARKSVSSAFFMLSGVAVLILAVGTLVYPFVPWARVFNVASPLAVREAGPTVLVFFACFLLNLPLGIAQRVQLGYQRGFITNLWRVSGSLMALGGLLLMIHWRQGLPFLVAAVLGGPILADLLNWITEFGLRHRWLFLGWRFFDPAVARKILAQGSQFFLLQLAGAVAFSSDNIVAAQVCGPSAVTQYAVPMRMFTALASVLALVNNPLWPAYGEAAVRGDIAWAKKTLKCSLWCTLLVSLSLAAILVLFGKIIVYHWVGAQVRPTFLLLVGMGIWTVIGTLGSALAMFLNATNLIRFELMCAVPLAFVAIVAKILMAHWMGIPGIIWGLVLAYAVTTAVPSVVYIPRALSRLKHQGVRFSDADRSRNAGATRQQAEKIRPVQISS